MPHCDDGLKEIYQAIDKYKEQNQGAYPPELQVLAENELLSPWTLVCPASEFGVGDCSYVYRGADLPAEIKPSIAKEVVVAHDKKPWHKHRRNVLFADGQVQRLPEKVFNQYIKKDNDRRGELGLAAVEKA